MPNKFGIVAVILLFVTLGSSQQRTSPERGCEPQADPCASASTQTDMNLCHGEQYRKADTHLNAIYRRLMDVFSENASKDQKQNEPIQKLKATEKAWLTYRDLHCSVARDQYEGGSMAPMVWAICMETVTQHRIEELRAAYENPELKIE